MTPVQAAILGAVQGITEFLPVSSSGHLVILQSLFEIAEEPVAFDVILHLGSVLAILAVYRADVASLVRGVAAAVRVVTAASLTDSFREAWRGSQDLRFVIAIGCTGIPTGLIGLPFKKFFESLFGRPDIVGFALLITGVLLFWAMRPREAKGTEGEVSIIQALLIGTAQGFAITPGISRSGSTIATALIAGVDRTTAAKFSFLMAVPAIFAALVVKMKDGVAFGGIAPATYAVGFIVSTLTSVLALKVLLSLVRRGSLRGFAYYCWVAGAGSLAYFGWLK